MHAPKGAPEIATFLYPLFDTHSLSPQTIRAIEPAQCSAFVRTGKASAVQDRTVSDMIASMELHRPRVVTPVLPQWDLGIVLEALSKPNWDSLREASLNHLTLKTVFLLVMASAGRHIELQALVFDPKYIQLKPKGAGAHPFLSNSGIIQIVILLIHNYLLQN